MPRRSESYRRNALDAARRVKFSREELGWTRRRLAEISGVGETVISKFEQGKVIEISAGNFLAICRALALDPLKVWFADAKARHSS